MFEDIHGLCGRCTGPYSRVCSVAWRCAPPPRQQAVAKGRVGSTRLWRPVGWFAALFSAVVGGCRRSQWWGRFCCFAFCAVFSGRPGCRAAFDWGGRRDAGAAAARLAFRVCPHWAGRLRRFASRTSVLGGAVRGERCICSFSRCLPGRCVSHTD